MAVVGFFVRRGQRLPQEKEELGRGACMHNRLLDTIVVSPNICYSPGKCYVLTPDIRQLIFIRCYEDYANKGQLELGKLLVRGCYRHL